ncbi:MAG TPA: ATP-binding cassette domain-containing protein [Nitriliruptorales bacterium]|nr:ATP-binding cassette domain-containing protein [Nitriliruptorales bacterium]
MIAVDYRSVAVHYPGSGAPALAGVDLPVATGEVLLVTGPSGSGKSTLLRLANGLVPHSSGGRLAGDVVTFDRSIRAHRPRDLADVVGFVHQDPEAQFVVDRVEADVAFVLENLGTDPVVMRRRVEEALDALGVAHLRHRSPTTLSAGERQRCAIAGALAAAPACLVLDEPTSQLDPQGADDVLASVTRLNADLGTTVLLAEHRLERAAPLADRAVVVDAGRVGLPGPPEAVLTTYPGAPEVTHLGALLGWDPPPLTVRQAQAALRRHGRPPGHPPPDAERAPGEMLLGGLGIQVHLGGRVVLRDAALVAHRGEVVVLMGRNGSGKTTLLRILAGLLEPRRGTVDRRGTVAYLPQDPNLLLFAPTVRDELRETLRLLGRDDPAAIDATLERFSLASISHRHPRSLSGGERQRVAIAAVAIGAPDVLLLDEPTRGIDAASRDALEAALSAHLAAGGAAVVATHDVELAARIATRAVVLGDGEVVAAGPARRVLSGSLFAPQVLRVVPPFLTVAEVAVAVAAPDGHAW